MSPENVRVGSSAVDAGEVAPAPAEAARGVESGGMSPADVYDYLLRVAERVKEVLCDEGLCGSDPEALSLYEKWERKRWADETGGRFSAAVGAFREWLYGLDDRELVGYATHLVYAFGLFNADDVRKLLFEIYKTFKSHGKVRLSDLLDLYWHMGYYSGALRGSTILLRKRYLLDIVFGRIRNKLLIHVQILGVINNFYQGP